MQAMDRFPQCQERTQAGFPGEARTLRRSGQRRPVPGPDSGHAVGLWETVLAATVILLMGGVALAQVPPGGVLPPPTVVKPPVAVLPPNGGVMPPRPVPAGTPAASPGIPGAGSGFATPAPGPRGTAARPVVSDILIVGNRHLSAEYIRNQMQTAVGKEYSSEQIQQDVLRLFATRQFGNVKADRQDDGPGRVKVIIRIEDYPSVVAKVTYLGNNKIKTSELEDLTSIRKGAACNVLANKVAARRIVHRYNEEGHPFAACDLLKGGQMGDTEVIFNITEGPKVRISDIRFTGNTFATGAQLKTHIQSSAAFLGLPIGGAYNEERLRRDMDELLKYYRAFGFHDVRVARELEYSPDGREVSVVFHVREGVRYKLAARPQVEGVKSIPADALESINKMKGGEYYNQPTIDGDVTRIRDWVGHIGREAAVRPVATFPPDKPGIVQVRYEVEERPPALVGQVFVVGNERTKMNVILRQLPLYPGQVLSFPALREAERNLARLNIFETSPDGAVKPTVTVLENTTNPDSPYRDILVSVQEASTGSLMFGLGVNSDSGLTGSIVLNERNFDLFRLPESVDDFINGTAFRGAGQEFRVEAVPGTQLQRYVVSFREPFLFDSPYSLTTSGYFYQRYFNEYAEDRVGGRFTLGRKVSDYWSVLGTIRLENVDVHDVPGYAPVDYTSVVGSNFVAGFRAGATFDNRDHVIRPTSGMLFDIGFEQVIGDYNFPLFTADLTNYWTVYQRADGSGRHVVSLHNQVGWAGSNTPVFERFFGGGFRSIRGFAFRGIGPDVNGFKIGGNAMVLNSLEYQVPVRASDDINLVGFIDAGTVAESFDKIDNYRVSVGFGVRFVMPMLGPVPIALDFGFPIVKGPHDQQQVFNFFMGWNR